MADRNFPFSPRTTTKLELGDLVAVPRDDGRWGCLQVTDLTRSGTGSRTSLVVGVLPWVGESPPRSQDIHGLTITEQGLTSVEVFTKGGLEVVGTSAVVPHGLSSNFNDFGVGTTHNVWGWRTAVKKVTAFRA